MSSAGEPAVVKAWQHVQPGRGQSQRRTTIRRGLQCVSLTATGKPRELTRATVANSYQPKASSVAWPPAGERYLTFVEASYPCRAVRAIAERPLAQHLHHLVHAAVRQRGHRPQAPFGDETSREHRVVDPRYPKSRNCPH